MTNHESTAVFGGGCFWCMEAVFVRLCGVTNVASGYAGGNKMNPTYEDVSDGNTGHVEVVQVTYDPSIIDYKTLLAVFFGTHDPTTLNRQGNDTGEQYRSVIFYQNDDQKQEAEAFIAQLTTDHSFGKPIVTTVEPLNTFYEAEDYHQHYYANNKGEAYCRAVINPKLAKLRQKFAPLLKDTE